jgi:hypothetical protein
LASGPPLALGMIKREMAYGASHNLEQTLEREKARSFEIDWCVTSI